MYRAELKNGELTSAEIIAIIDGNKELLTTYQTRELYYKGDNYTILNQADREDSVPDNRITVPYGRKIAMTVKNYLFSRDPTYSCDDKDYLAMVNKIFYVNDNTKKISEIGLDIILHGVGYKLFYTDFIDGMKIPRYVIIDQSEGVPVYSMDIEPKLIAFIRYYDINNLETSQIKSKVEIYYPDKTVFYDYDGQLKYIREAVNEYRGFVPVVVYGDDYQVGIFDPVKRLIDAVDIIMSADINEIQRFEMLYIVLVGGNMPDDPDELDMILKRRIFELPEQAKMSFLERHIDGEFNISLFEKMQDLIYSMSGVPDFASKEFAAESGVALLYKLMGFENVASDVEQEFYKGERDSFDLINVLLYGVKNTQEFMMQNPDKMFDITLNKNLPENVAAKLDEAIKMQQLGISTETIFDYIPVIENAEDEVKKSIDEKKSNFEAFQIQARSRVEEPQEPIAEPDDISDSGN